MSGDPNLRHEALDTLRARGRLKRFSQRQTILGRGEPGAFLGIIESGAVRISVFNAEGRELALALLGPQDVFGEVAVLDGFDRTADAIAVGKADVTVVSAADVHSLMRQDHAVSAFFVKILCQRLRGSNAHAEAHALGSLSGRLALQLLNLGHEDENGMLIVNELPSQSELARLVGCSRESINRQFRSWEKAGKVLFGEKSLKVPDPIDFQETAV